MKVKKTIGWIFLVPIIVGIIAGSLYGVWLLGSWLWPIVSIYIGQFLLGLLAVCVVIGAIIGIIGGIVNQIDET